MSKGAYIGVNGVARKVKKIYIGVNGVARRIKKAYIGVGGVARLFWSGGKPAYYGTITPLATSVYQLAATSIGDYALFGGGQSSGGNHNLEVDVYDKSLVKSNPTFGLSATRYDLAAAHTEVHAIFSGGYGGLTEVDAFDTSLTRSSAPKPDVGRYRLAGTQAGEYAVFAGGYGVGTMEGRRNDVDAYDNSLVRTIPEPLSKSRDYIGAASIGGYALFVGGQVGSSNYSTDVDCYDSSLTKISVEPLQEQQYGMVGAVAGNYAVFGCSRRIGYGRTYAYDKSLTQIITDSMYAELNGVVKGDVGMSAATSLGDYAIFAGGWSSAGTFATSWVVDSSLTIENFTPLSSARRLLAAASVGDFAIFAGGANTSTVATADAYTLV